MPPIVRNAATTVHGRYLVDEPAAGRPEAMLVGFHGYAERAEDSLAALQTLRADEPWLLVAIQGLHPFYRRSDGEVIASWMTKLDRELAIADNLGWVNRVLAEVRRDYPSSRRSAAVGFSQGVAMTYRAAAHSGHPFHALVALAGDVPPELHGLDLRGFPAVLIGRGDEEEWYTEAKLESDLTTLAETGIEAHECRFAGGHEWADAFVERARGFLSSHLERAR